jgi:hypothetical protein
MNTKYSHKDREKIANVVVCLRDICCETDAQLARLLGIHRTNIAAFNKKRRLGAVTVAGISKMLTHYGLCFSETKELKSIDKEYCPIVKMIEATDAEVERIGLFVEALSGYAKVYLCPILNGEGDFALIWDTRLSKSPWCCVGLGLGPENPAFKTFKALPLVQEGLAVEVPADMYETWTLTSPRKSEVLSVFARLFRKIPANELTTNIESAMPGDFLGGGLKTSESSSASLPL